MWPVPGMTGRYVPASPGYWWVPPQTQASGPIWCHPLTERVGCSGRRPNCGPNAAGRLDEPPVSLRHHTLSEVAPRFAKSRGPLGLSPLPEANPGSSQRVRATAGRVPRDRRFRVWPRPLRPNARPRLPSPRQPCRRLSRPRSASPRARLAPSLERRPSSRIPRRCRAKRTSPSHPPWRHTCPISGRHEAGPAAHAGRAVRAVGPTA